jgi:hypothetical protein
MARERTADDEVLGLLARSALPLERSEIANALGWGKSMVSRVLQRLMRLEKIDALPGSQTGEAGRPSEKFTLKDAKKEATPLGVPLVPRFEPDTYVITPTAREARVILHRRDGFVEIEYLDGPRGIARTVVHATNLRAFQPGRDKPDPVRKA